MKVSELTSMSVQENKKIERMTDQNRIETNDRCGEKAKKCTKTFLILRQFAKIFTNFNKVFNKLLKILNNLKFEIERIKITNIQKLF